MSNTVLGVGATLGALLMLAALVVRVARGMRRERRWSARTTTQLSTSPVDDVDDACFVYRIKSPGARPYRIGHTDNPPRRFGEYLRNPRYAYWFLDSPGIDLWRYPTTAEAVSEEIRRIHEEHPLDNDQHNGAWSPRHDQAKLAPRPRRRPRPYPAR